MPKTRQFNLALEAHQLTAAKHTAATKGFTSLSAYVRDLLDQDSRRTTFEERLEASLAASLDRMAEQVHRVQQAQEAHAALTDSLVRLFLTCTPEPPDEAIAAAKRQAKLRYARLINGLQPSGT